MQMTDAEEKLQTKKFIKLTTEPVKPLICKMAIPTIITMLVTSVYNMADTYFVGKISTSASAAIGVAFSLMAVIQAIGFFFGQGSGVYISRKLGMREGEKAKYMAASAFFMSLAIGIIIMVTGLIFLKPLCYLLGSTDTIYSHARGYVMYVLIGAPFMTASLTLNNQLRFQGSAVYGMIGIGSGLILNIILDPILIFAFNMGAAGAGLATAISQFVGMCLLLFGTFQQGNIKINPANFRFNKEIISGIISGGLPSLCRQSVASVSGIVLNNICRPYGDSAIAAMAIVSRIISFTTSVMIGFGQGYQPVCGFNYGAKKYKRVKEGFFFCLIVNFSFLLAVSAIAELFAPYLVEFFRDDADVISFGARALRFQCIAYPFSAIAMITNMTLQNFGKTFSATFLSLARQGLFFIPAIVLMSMTFGEMGIQSAQMAADIITILIAIPFAINMLKELDARANEAENAEKSELESEQA